MSHANLYMGHANMCALRAQVSISHNQYRVKCGPKNKGNLLDTQQVSMYKFGLVLIIIPTTLTFSNGE
jgi:hypothetical protein